MSIPNTSVAAYSCVYLNPFLRRIFSLLCDVKHFAVEIFTAVFLFWGGFFFSLHRLSFDCSVTLPVIRINRFFGQIVDRQNTHLDTSTTPVWQQKNWICSFRFWFSFLPFFPADDTDVLIHHDSTLYPSHLCLFFSFSPPEDGRRWVSQAWSRPKKPRPVSWERQRGTFNLVCFAPFVLSLLKSWSVYRVLPAQGKRQSVGIVCVSLTQR